MNFFKKIFGGSKTNKESQQKNDSGSKTTSFSNLTKTCDKCRCKTDKVTLVLDPSNPLQSGYFCTSCTDEIKSRRSYY